MSPCEITLTYYQLQSCATCGILRNIEAIDRPDAHGYRKEWGWNEHIEGACGEQAAALATNRQWYWTVNTFKEPDLLPNIGVRTRSRHEYDLLIRPNDNPDYLYIHVTGKAPKFLVHGYMRGSDARQEKWWKDYADRPPAWFVPKDQLLPWQHLCLPVFGLPRQRPQLTGR